jgi:hypothetical protein
MGRRVLCEHQFPWQAVSVAHRAPHGLPNPCEPKRAWSQPQLRNASRVSLSDRNRQTDRGEFANDGPSLTGGPASLGKVASTETRSALGAGPLSRGGVALR